MTPLILLFVLQAQIAQIEPQPLPAGVPDKGVNVLLDSAHDVLFFWLWDTAGFLRDAGFRVTGSQATLDTVLVPGRLSRMRDQTHHAFEFRKPDGTTGRYHRPFAMLPNPKFNVVIAYQFQEAQHYLPAERSAVRQFVREGGGLVVLGRARGGMKSYPLQELLDPLGAQLTPDAAAGPFEAADHPAVAGFRQPAAGAVWGTAKVGPEWTPVLTGSDGAPIIAVREYGRGRIVLFADQGPYREGSGQANVALLASAVSWAAGGSEPVGGTREVSWEHIGVGGAIYPEESLVVAGVTVLYARNQTPGVLDAIRNRTQEVRDLLSKMLPSPPVSPEEMYVIPAAGMPGSGWAVNVYTPKEAQICSHDTDVNGLLSVMAHEVAHTMTGPAAEDGSTGGRLPEQGIGLFSEAHAGWFQQKVGVALGWQKATGNDRLLALEDPTLEELDLRRVPAGKVSVAWAKLWRLYQILEYRHGEGWYADWMRLIHERYRDDPEHELSWPEVVASMSDAVGEDLFPLFRAIGTPVDAPLGWSQPKMKTLDR
jgi:hypothetical protein